MRRTLTLIALATVVWSQALAPAAMSRGAERRGRVHAPETPGELKVEIVVDELYIKKVIGNKVGALFASQFGSDDPACRAAAVLVSQEAVNNYAYWTTSVDLLKETGKGIELGGKLAGVKSVEKAGQLAFTVAEALEDEEPEAALGRAVVAETFDWAKGKIPKNAADKQIKAQADAAKDKITKALFPGVKKKAKTHKTTVGDCTVSVTPEIQWPDGKSRADRGGIWLHIDGNCACKKPLRLNTVYSVPTTFHGQPDDIKNCGLGAFAIHAFLPMVRLETSVSWAGTAINLKDLASKSADLHGWIKDYLKGKSNDKKPLDLAKELKKLVNNATTVSPVLMLKPVYADRLELNGDPYAKCNNCENSEPARTDPLDEARKIPEDPCRRRCNAEYDAWIAALQAEATARKRHEDTEIGRSIKTSEGDLSSLKAGVNDAQNRLNQAEAKVSGYQREAAAKGFDVRELGDIWTRALASRDQARINLQEAQGKVKRKETELDGLRKQDAAFEKQIAGLASKTATAKARFDDCMRRCKDEERSAKDPLPTNTKIDPCLIGQWKSWTLRQDPYENIFSGATLSFAGDGRAAIQYDHARMSNGDIVFVYENNGSANGVVRTDKGRISLVSFATSPQVTELIYDNDGKAGKPYTVTGFGPLAPPSQPTYMEYKCDGTTLTYNTFGGLVTFKRAGTMP